MPNVMCLLLMRPSFPRSSWSYSMALYSVRRLSSSSPRRGMAILSRYVSVLAAEFTKLN